MAGVQTVTQGWAIRRKIYAPLPYEHDGLHITGMRGRVNSLMLNKCLLTLLQYVGAGTDKRHRCNIEQLIVRRQVEHLSSVRSLEGFQWSKPVAMWQAAASGIIPGISPRCLFVDSNLIVMRTWQCQQRDGAQQNLLLWVQFYYKTAMYYIKSPRLFSCQEELHDGYLPMLIL